MCQPCFGGNIYDAINSSKNITPKVRTGNHVVGNGYAPRWAISGNFLVLTEEKPQDFNSEQFVSYRD